MLAWFGVSALGTGPAAAEEESEDERSGGLLTEVARVVDEDLVPVVDDVARLADPVAQPLATHVVEPAGATLEHVGHEVVQPTVDAVAEPLVAPVRDDVVRPVVHEAVAPLVDATVGPVADEVLRPVFDDVVTPVVEPLASPLAGPLVQGLAPTVGAIGDVVDPRLVPSTAPDGTTRPTAPHAETPTTEAASPGDDTPPSADHAAGDAVAAIDRAAATRVAPPVDVRPNDSDAVVPFAPPTRPERTAVPQPHPGPVGVVPASVAPTASGDSSTTGDTSAVLSGLRQPDLSSVARVAPGSDHLDRGVPPRPPVTPD